MRVFRYATLLVIPVLGLWLAACNKPQVKDDWALFRRSDEFFNRFIEPDERYLWRLKPGSYPVKDLPWPDPEMQGRAKRGELDNLPPLVVNEKGMRGKLPSRERPALRILCLGDSVTFGYERPYPEVLEELLSKKLGIQVEVLNGGVPGYSIVQSRRWFTDELAALKPDLVLGLFGWNDAKDLLRGYEDMELLASGWDRWLAQWKSQGSLQGVIGEDPLAKEGNCCRVPPQVFEEEMKALSEAVHASGGRLVNITYPASIRNPLYKQAFPAVLVNSRLHRIGAQGSALGSFSDFVIPMAEWIDTPPERQYFRDPLADPVHPSESGAQLMAQYVTNFIADRILRGPGQSR